jgi:hypothetical protein
MVILEIVLLLVTALTFLLAAYAAQRFLRTKDGKARLLLWSLFAVIALDQIGIALGCNCLLIWPALIIRLVIALAALSLLAYIVRELVIGGRSPGGEVEYFMKGGDTSDRNDID